jgi:hypothetical protein
MDLVRLLFAAYRDAWLQFWSQLTEDFMPTVMALHDVKDTKHWLASPKRKEVFEPICVTNIRTFVDPQKPNRVGLVMEIADMDRFAAFMKTKPAIDAMEHDGVVQDSLVVLVQS